MVRDACAEFPLTHACINPIGNTPEDARGGIYYYSLSSPTAIQTPVSFDLIGRGEGAPSNGVLRLFDRFEHGILAPLVESRVI